MLNLKNIRSHPGNESNATSIEVIKIECDDANNKRSITNVDTSPYKGMERKCLPDDSIKPIVNPSVDQGKQILPDIPARLSASEPVSNTKNVSKDALSFSSPTEECDNEKVVEQRVTVRKKPTFKIVHTDDLLGRIDRLCRSFTSETRAIKYLMDVIIAATNEDTPCSVYHRCGNLCVRFAKQQFILTIMEIT